MGEYAKALLAMLGVVASTFVAVLSDNVVEPIEIANMVLLAVGAFGVYVVPNLPGYTAAKFFVLAITAGVQYLVNALDVEDAALTWPLWLQVISTAVAAGIVWLVPNQPDTV